MNVTIENLDEIRKNRFRPGVVGVFVYQKKVLLFYKEKWKLWQFPQGGIDNNETVEQALKREMSEELGEDFAQNIQPDFQLVMKDKIRFRGNLHGSRTLTTDDGDEIKMVGKFYFYVTAEVSQKKISIDKTEFDDYKWLSFDQAMKLAENIYQKNKKRALMRVLKILLGKNLIE